MQFLNPIWFLALAAISVPLLIHLWNIRPGKTLKVGSVALVEASAQKSSRSFKVSQWPLLLLRCLLLVLLAVLLAGPFIEQYIIPKKAKGWLLIPKAYYSETRDRYKTLVDSLLKAGYELRYFENGFPKIDTTKSPAADTAQVNYWAVVKALDRSARGVPVQIITPDRAAYFKGKRPVIGIDLKWHTYTPADSLSKWIAHAWFTPDENLMVVQGEGSPTGTRFSRKVINSDDATFTINADNGKATIKVKNSAQPALLVDTAVLRTAVFSANSDGDYVVAALRSIEKFSKIKMEIRRYSSASQIPSGQSWLFWLADKPLDKATLQKAAHVFAYAKGKPVKVDSWLKASPYYTIAGEQQPVGIYKLITSKPNTDAIWSDSFGNPVLTADSALYQYDFYSRFSPGWSDVVWSGDLPRLLFGLLINKDASSINKLYDRRSPPRQQLLPIATGNINKADTVLKKQTDLSRYFWLALAVMFLGERWLAHYYSRKVAND